MIRLGEWLGSFYVGNLHDREKAILPALVYISSPPEEYPNLDGFGFNLAWWSWGVQVTFARLKKLNKEGKG